MQNLHKYCQSYVLNITVSHGKLAHCTSLHYKRPLFSTQNVCFLNSKTCWTGVTLITAVLLWFTFITSVIALRTSALHALCNSGKQIHQVITADTTWNSVHRAGSLNKKHFCLLHHSWSHFWYVCRFACESCIMILRLHRCIVFIGTCYVEAESIDFCSARTWSRL